MRDKIYAVLTVVILLSFEIVMGFSFGGCASTTSSVDNPITVTPKVDTPVRPKIIIQKEPLKVIKELEQVDNGMIVRDKELVRWYTPLFPLSITYDKSLSEEASEGLFFATREINNISTSRVFLFPKMWYFSNMKMVTLNGSVLVSVEGKETTVEHRFHDDSNIILSAEVKVGVSTGTSDFYYTIFLRELGRVLGLEYDTLDCSVMNKNAYKKCGIDKIKFTDNDKILLMAPFVKVGSIR